MSKTTVNYAVIGKDVKESKLITSLKDFIELNYNSKGVRIGYSKFIKEFAKWDSEKLTVNANSLDLHKAIFSACFKIASFNKKHNIDVMPIFYSDKSNNVSIVSVTSVKDFDTYYGNTKAYTEKPKKDPTLFVIDYIDKHSDEIDFKTLKNYLSDF